MNKAQDFEITDIRVAYSKFLYYKKIKPQNSLSEGISNPIQIPFGSVSAKEIPSHRFFVSFDGSKIVRLFAISKKLPSEEITIVPEYRWSGKISIDGKKVDVEIREIINDIDRLHAMQVIMRSHYLSPPVRGLYLGCWLTNRDQINVIRKAARKNQEDSWSDSWAEPIANSGILVGCALLDTLYHGMPRGRKLIAKLDGNTKLLASWDKVSRKQVVDELDVAWISRVAVDAPYRSIGLGAVLAKHMFKVGYYHRVPRARYIEVITTERSENAKLRLKNPEKSFLGQAGYELDQDIRPSRRMLFQDSQGNRSEFHSVRRLYYYAKAKPNAKRKR